MSNFQTILSLKINENPLKIHGSEDEIFPLKKKQMAPGIPGDRYGQISRVLDKHGIHQTDFQGFYLDVHGSDRN